MPLLLYALSVPLASVSHMHIFTEVRGGAWPCPVFLKSDIRSVAEVLDEMYDLHSVRDRVISVRTL